MDPSEVRYRAISALLRAAGPLTLAELVAESGITTGELSAVLKQLVNDQAVVQGRLVAGKPSPQYCWAARWEQRARREAARSTRELRAAVAPADAERRQPRNIDGEAACAFCDFVIHHYSPPKDKRLVVFLQCSVRRPFSSSPSHGSMKRAIAVATGCDPKKDFEACPVHVVVLASTLGPVPYELEDVYPANVGGGGVKHFSDDHYARVKPILAERMAGYITAHRESYDHIATFTHARYGEVMREARRIARVEFPVLPVQGGPAIVRMGRSRPRTYWQKYWIQLYLQIVGWLQPAQQAQAQARLKAIDVVYR